MFILHIKYVMYTTQIHSGIIVTVNRGLRHGSDTVCENVFCDNFPK